jgi:cell division protein FtsN
MALDYHERKPVGKNKPRKQPGKSLAGLLLAMAGVGYVAGVVSGWIFFRAPEPKITINQVQAPAPVQPGGPQPMGGEPTQPGSAPPTLTFYDTLPKGSGAVMGSGVNLAPARPAISSLPPAVPAPAEAQPKPAEPTAKPSIPSQETPVKPPTPVAVPAAAKPAPSVTLPKPAPQKTATYTVQAASCQTRAEAEQIRNRLAKAGFSSYITEATVPGKGTWYRIRIGRGLSQAQAMDTAAKAGAGAEAVPEQSKSP